MVFKNIIIVLVPDGTNRIRQFRLPRFLLLSLVFFFAYLPWVIRDYQVVRAKIPQLAQLQKENEQQAGQFNHLAQRVEQVTRKMLELKEIDRKLRVITNLEKGDDNALFVAVGGSDQKLLVSHYSEATLHQDLVRSMHHSLDDLANEIAIGREDKTELHKYLEDQKMLLASTPSIWPTKGWLSSGFGYRISPFTEEREFHSGIDISTRKNTPVVAPANGIVASMGRDPGYGNMIFIKHGYGLVTKYAHLEKALVRKGQYVRRNQRIGLVGNTGRSIGPHLHYEVQLNGVPVNPARYILN